MLNVEDPHSAGSVGGFDLCAAHTTAMARTLITPSGIATILALVSSATGQINSRYRYGGA
jgi:hypothetical protein